MIQIDGKKRHTLLKFVDDTVIQNILQTMNGRFEYKHVTGVISIVRLKVAGMDMRRIRIANLPPEGPKRTLRVALAPHAEIVLIHDETWSKACRYTVTNGIKVVMMKLNNTSRPI